MALEIRSLYQRHSPHNIITKGTLDSRLARPREAGGSVKREGLVYRVFMYTFKLYMGVTDCCINDTDAPLCMNPCPETTHAHPLSNSIS